MSIKFSGTIECPIDCKEKEIQAYQVSKSVNQNITSVHNQINFGCEHIISLPNNGIGCNINNTRECVMMSLGGMILQQVDSTHEQATLTKKK